MVSIAIQALGFIILYWKVKNIIRTPPLKICKKNRGIICGYLRFTFTGKDLAENKKTNKILKFVSEVWTRCKVIFLLVTLNIYCNIYHFKPEVEFARTLIVKTISLKKVLLHGFTCLWDSLKLSHQALQFFLSYLQYHNNEQSFYM